jgi:nucleoside-diphosphate-sugar epimerase
MKSYFGESTMGRMKVAVTGAAGQVGSVLVRRLQQYPEIETIAVCRNTLSAALIADTARGCQIRIGSIADAKSAAKILNDCDAIINCALAMISGKPKLSRNMNKTMIDNYAGIERLKKFVHMSSISVYGGCIDRTKKAKSTFENPRPDNDYGRSKLYIEKYANSIFSKKDIKFYNLRLGHVIGANMDRSKEILKFAGDPKFRLPFDGKGPSNAVHVEELAAKVISIITTETIPPGTYNVANKKESWRDVFNWHTRATGLPEVLGMEEKRSEDIKKYYRSRSIVKDLIAWLKSLPILRLLEYPAIFEFAYGFLAIAPENMTSYLATKYKKISVQKQVKAIKTNEDYLIGPVYYSDNMPGTFLESPVGFQIGDVPPNEELIKEVREWYLQFSQARWLPNSL